MPSTAVQQQPTSTPARSGLVGTDPKGFKERLARDLPAIDDEGWDGATACALLLDLRERLVGPVLAAEGLRDVARAQAEAAAWQKVWQALTTESIRTAANPWPALWTVARRAVHDEVVAARMLTSVRKAWKWSEREEGDGPTSGDRGRNWVTFFSVESMRDAGIELPDDAEPGAAGPGLGERLELIADALVDVGWRPQDARAVLRALSDAAAERRTESLLLGWRPIARELGLAAWSVRRVQVLLCGHGACPGLLELMLIDGPEILADCGIARALRSTVRRQDPSPESLLGAYGHRLVG